MNNKRFLFLIAWIDGSPTALETFADETNVREQEDLLTEYGAGNELVLVLDIFAPNKDVAEAIGWRHAISDNGGGYTMDDTFSLVKEIGKLDELVPTQHNVEVPIFIVTDEEVLEEVSG